MPRKKKEEQQEDAIMSNVLSGITNTPEKEAEDAQRMEDRQTRGVKGLRLERFNATFSPENFQYLKIMSSLKGETITSYLNDIVTKDKEANADTYKEAEKLIAKLRN